MKPVPLALLSLLVIAAGSAPPAAHLKAARQDTGAIESGGIGVTRAPWEAEHGAGELVDAATPVFGELYAYESGTYYIAFEGSKTEADDVAMYIEVVWGDDGVPFEEAQVAVQALLPVDAAVSEAYFAPPSPGGPMALNTFRYVSASLATVPYGTTTLTPNVLVTYHQRIETIDTGHQIVHEEHVTRVSIMAQIPPG